MSLRAYRTFQALILAATGLGMLTLALDGHMLDYIHPRLIILTVMAALAMIILAQFVLRERPANDEMIPIEQEDASSRSVSGLWWTVLPLLVGLLVSEPQPAASAAQLRDNPTPVGQTAVLEWAFTADESKAAANRSMPGILSDWQQPVLMLNRRWLYGWLIFQTYGAEAFPVFMPRPDQSLPYLLLFYQYD